MHDDWLRSLDQPPREPADQRGPGQPRGRRDLGTRLDSLPDGHPSSRYDADGTPRAPTSRLRNLDPWPDAADTRPYTDAEWSEHLSEVCAGLDKAHADGLSTDHLYALDDDGEAWTPSRREIHRVIIEHFYDASAAVPPSVAFVVCANVFAKRTRTSAAVAIRILFIICSIPIRKHASYYAPKRRCKPGEHVQGWMS